MKALEGQLAEQEVQKEGPVATRGALKVNGPLPADFAERLQQAAARAVPCNVEDVKVLDTYALDKDGDLVEVTFEGPRDVVHAIEDQSADPKSKLVDSPLRDFLVAPGSEAAEKKYGEAPEVAIRRRKRRRCRLFTTFSRSSE